MPLPTSAQPSTSSEKAAAATRVAAPREFYIDRLRSVMTALVILHHTAITYGAIGGWFWYELKPSRAVSSQLLIEFCTINQAYFMGFFFLLAGYFTPGSLDRKGYGAFIRDRFLRLGIPLLAFIVLLGPLTAAIAHTADGGTFWGVFPYLWSHAIIIPGPLWFAEALLIFSLVYCAWRALFDGSRSAAKDLSSPIPSWPYWLLTALLTGIAALAIRQFVPVGVNIASLQLGYFASYIFLFSAGIAAWRHNWIRQLSWKNASTPILVSLLVLPAMPIGVLISHAVDKHGANFGGGLSWHAILYALWEPFVAWGIITGLLLLFRRYLNQPSALWEWLGRRAYAVYIIHPPVLVGVALLLHGWVAPALVKFAVVGALSCAATWLVADPLVRIPGVRRVV
jgi:peptidoglycan/LPS O-acetylase OafA/YrhL